MPRMPGLFGRRAGARKDPVQVLQEALSEAAPTSLTSLTAALTAIVDGSLWRQKRPLCPLASLPLLIPPVGLGVRSLAPLGSCAMPYSVPATWRQWTEVLERVARQRGRPRKKLVNDEDFVPFYSLPTASTSRDRLLLALKRGHRRPFRGGMCGQDLAAGGSDRSRPDRGRASRAMGEPATSTRAAALTERAQGRLLFDLFNAMSANAQCTLIARALEPRLGFGLAERWRCESLGARQAHNLKVVGSNPTPATNFRQ